MWNSGERYDGEWISDEMSGSGTYTFPDGSYLSGSFQANALTNGEYHIENEFGTYSFTVTDGVPTAVEMVLKTGTTYNGSMVDGKLSGRALIKYSNGDSYDGAVKEGQKDGNGSYTWASGASYEGNWQNDLMSGSGTYFYPKTEDGYKLVGSFQNGKPNGQCQYYENSATSYKTDWTNGKCTKVYEG